MSQINGVGGSNPIHTVVNQPSTRSAAAEPASRPAITDKLELSGMGGMLKLLKTDGVRTDKVAQIKAQIEAGTYETDDKLNVAVDRMLDDML